MALCLKFLRIYTFSLWVIHQEGLCPSSGDINRLMTMIRIKGVVIYFFNINNYYDRIRLCYNYYWYSKQYNIQTALGPGDGLWPVLLICVIVHKEGMCSISGDINNETIQFNLYQKI
jgi:hypothetical protein